MKLLIAFAAVAILGATAIALTEQQKEILKAFHAECSAVSGVDQEVISKARRGEFVDDPKFKVHLFCFSKKAGFQNEAGQIQKDVLRAKLTAQTKNEELTEKLIAKCAIQKATPEETSFESIKCFYENTPNRISLA